MSSPAEIELKLAVVSGQPRDVARLLDLKRRERVNLEDAYFDTPDALLRRRGLVLRVRREGDRWLQTLKAAQHSRTLVSERGEWEVELGRGGEPPVPDLTRFDGDTPDVLASQFDPARLVPVFRTQVERERGTVLYGASRIEAALDEGELQARADGKQRQRRVCEVELELKAGQPADVLGLARELVGRCKGKATLVPAIRSKAERGYALAFDGAPVVARASARGFTATLRSGTPTAEALRAVTRHGLTIVVANADALREDAKSELVHQTRVALRRIRSAVRLFDRGHQDLGSRLATQLHWLAQTLGQARDWDVLVGTTLPTIAPQMDPDAHQRLRADAVRERKRALARAVRAVSSHRYAGLVLGIAQWTLTPPEASAPLAQVASTLLDDLADRMFAAARGFARLSTHERHRVRIRAKRLRYALDLLAVALPGRAASDYIDALAELQDTLGELNDASVALHLLSELAERRTMRRALDKWHHGLETAYLKTAVARIGALARRSRPWNA